MYYDVILTKIRWMNIVYVFVSLFVIVFGNIGTKYRANIGWNICSNIRGDTSLHFAEKDVCFYMLSERKSINVKAVQAWEGIRSQSTSLGSTVAGSFNEGGINAVSLPKGETVHTDV